MRSKKNKTFFKKSGSWASSVFQKQTPERFLGFFFLRSKKNKTFFKKSGSWGSSETHREGCRSGVRCRSAVSEEQEEQQSQKKKQRTTDRFFFWGSSVFQKKKNTRTAGLPLAVLQRTTPLLEQETVCFRTILETRKHGVVQTRKHGVCIFQTNKQKVV